MLAEQALTARMTSIADALSGASAILDLGCGAGDLLRTRGTLLGEEACCVGVDLSQDMLAMARAKLADCPRTYVIQTDVTQPLPFADDTLDLGASLNLLQEVSAPTLVLEEACRILKPGAPFEAWPPAMRGTTRRKWSIKPSPGDTPGISSLPGRC